MVFTDIEGSTRLLERLGPERYRESLAVHHRLLRGAFERHDGYEVDNEGDAFFVAFGRAADAVAAASEAQQALAHAEWPEGQPMRVRMGIHTGEPLATPPKYVGLDVHKAARIMAAGHGGQVLVSAATRDLLDGHVLLRELGDHRLKDLGRPVRLWQLGDAEFPSLRSLHRTNLPVQPLPLIGRERELDELTRALREATGLLTLTGVGGAGKTRLAMQAAAEVADAFPDGVWFVPLAPVADHILVESAAARRSSGCKARSRTPSGRSGCSSFWTTSSTFSTPRRLWPRSWPPPPACGSGDEPRAAGADRGARIRSAAAAALGCGRPVQCMPQIDPRFQPDEDVVEIAGKLDGLPLALELAAARVEGADACADQRAAGEEPRFAVRWSQGRARTPTHAPRNHQMELRPLAGGRAQCPQRPLGVRRQLRLRSGGIRCRCRLRVDRVAGRQEPASPSRRGPASSCSRRSASSVNGSSSQQGTLARLRIDHAQYYLGVARAHAVAPWVPFRDEWARRFLTEEPQPRAALSSLAETGDLIALQEAAKLLWYTWFRFGRLDEGRSWLEKVTCRPARRPACRRSASVRALRDLLAPGRRISCGAGRRAGGRALPQARERALARSCATRPGEQLRHGR